MRPIKRLARRTQAAMRRPPKPLWRRLGRRLAILAIACLVTGWSAAALWSSPRVARVAGETRDRLLAVSVAHGLGVRDLVVDGDDLADREQVIHILEEYRGQSILAVDLHEIRERLERLVWVREAMVGRELPRTLRVRIVEHRVAARWHDGVRQVLISDAGTVLGMRVGRRYGDLPLLHGDGAPERLGELRAIMAGEPELARSLTAARLVGGRRWDVSLGRIEVRLPAKRPEEAWRRLAREHRATGLLRRSITAVDLRHPEWLTVRPLLESTLPTAREPRA